MKIAIAGGTGFIGQELTSYLLDKGHEVYILTRKKVNSTNSNIHYIQWMKEGASPERELEGISAFVNLAGESINSGRWNAERKKRILESRLHVTKEVLRILQHLKTKPSVLINASAIGIYGHSETETFTEKSQKTGDDFLANVTKKWEETAQKANDDLNIRTVFVRFGIVLHKNEGALPRMALPYQLCIGGKLGTGHQWFSWIHVKDAVRLILHTIETNDMKGPLNLTAPEPLQMNDFGKVLGKTLGKPHWLPTPAFPLKILLGEMSDLILKGQKVIPEKAIKHGFTFLYPNLESALKDIYHPSV